MLKTLYLVLAKVKSGHQNILDWLPHYIKARSKDFVNLFHRAGHYIRYDSLIKVDTTLSEDTLAYLDEITGAVIPKNIVPGKFIHFSADNIDIRDESLDGKNIFSATQMAAYQRGDEKNL